MSSQFTEFHFPQNFDVSETPEIKKLEGWLEEVDTVIAAIGD